MLEYSKILSISIATEMFTILIFPPFLSFSLLDQFHINLNYITILSTELSCQIDLRKQTRIYCLPLFLFSIFCFYINLRLMMLFLDCSLLAHVTGVSTLLQLLRWDDQSRYFLVLVSYICTISTRSRKWWSLCITYINKSLSCRFPVEILSWFSAVPCERWVW